MFGNIKKVREDLDYTQTKMAEILNVSKSSYNYFETGEHFIPLKHLINFCNTFHVTMDYVCGLTNKKVISNVNMPLNNDIVKVRLREIREKHGLKQVEVAGILNTCQSNISAYESGKTRILTAFLITFAKYFNVSIDYIMGRSNEPNIKKK